MNTRLITETSEEYNFTASNEINVRQVKLLKHGMTFIEFSKDGEFIYQLSAEAQTAMIEFINWKNSL